MKRLEMGAKWTERLRRRCRLFGAVVVVVCWLLLLEEVEVLDTVRDR